MSLYQSLCEPPILTAIIGAKCSDGIVLVADQKITRINNEKLESAIRKKIDSRIVRGIGDKESQGWTKALSIGVGGLEVALSGLIMASPAFGAATVGFLIGIALLLAGIQIIVAGISGRRKQMKILDTRND